jgi:hypothetical protein
MSLYVIFQWSVDPPDQARCDEQLAAIAEHIRTDHPEIVGTRLYKQWTGPMPRRGYTWMEEYESFTKLDEGEITPSCMEVWAPVERMAQAGTFKASVWFDGPEEAQLVRS